jgi:hypothetical protein
MIYHCFMSQSPSLFRAAISHHHGGHQREEIQVDEACLFGDFSASVMTGLRKMEVMKSKGAFRTFVSPGLKATQGPVNFDRLVKATFLG